MDDDRAEPRARWIPAGKIILSNGDWIDCTFRNRSDFGARLSVADAVRIPDEFRLSIGPRAEQHDVTVAWRETTEIGVRFKGGMVA